MNQRSMTMTTDGVGMTWRQLIATIWLATMAGAFGVADARSHAEGRRSVPAMVARALPAVVSITTQQIAERSLGNIAMAPAAFDEAETHLARALPAPPS